MTISVGGGDEPAWAHSGAEIFYRREGELMVVPVERTGFVLNVGTPRRLFEDTYRRDTAGAQGVANYDVSPEGDRFVMVEDRSAPDPSVAASTRLRVVLNFFEELCARPELSVAGRRRTARSPTPSLRELLPQSEK